MLMFVSLIVSAKQSEMQGDIQTNFIYTCIAIKMWWPCLSPNPHTSSDRRIYKVQTSEQGILIDNVCYVIVTYHTVWPLICLSRLSKICCTCVCITNVEDIPQRTLVILVCTWDTTDINNYNSKIVEKQVLRGQHVGYNMWFIGSVSVSGSSTRQPSLASRPTYHLGKKDHLLLQTNVARVS